MEFDELLIQVIALLQRQGRVSYGALTRRFMLDDDYLEYLKVELIEAQDLVADEQRRILFTGDRFPQVLLRCSTSICSAPITVRRPRSPLSNSGGQGRSSPLARVSGIAA